MAHDHGHHEGAGVVGSAGTSARTRLAVALGITAAFLVIEAAGGLLTGSLALLADAGHMLGDACALGMALWASSLALRPPDGQRSFGYGRAEVIAAFVNAIILLGMVLTILLEVPGRLSEPREILETPMMLVAGAGLAANIVSGLVLAGGRRQSINVRGALLHVISDSLGSVGVLAAGAVIALTGWTRADAIASLIVAALMALGAVRLVRETWPILMEGAPAGVDRERMTRSLMEIDGVVQVHSIHIWCLTPGSHAMSAHIVTREGEDPATVLAAAREALPGDLGIDHVTLQIEACKGEALPECPVGCGPACRDRNVAGGKDMS